MIAAAFAELVGARPAGRGRWQAKCPAHHDHSPSLAIAEGAEGRVLVRCWAGCGLRDILAVLGLSMRDLFAGEPPTLQQAGALARERATRLTAEREQAAVERELGDLVRRLHFAANAIVYKLARIPEGQQPERATRLTELFNVALEWLRVAEEGFAHA